ncbi:prorelaxin H1 [Tenrec ecaudatus]|uniref:prorelaxin H1 n=1 Tax=Tenrec ecaudatus TaxID=94439 RepID=UPI003F5A831F
MPRILLINLLQVALLLSQFHNDLLVHGNENEVVQACGRKLARKRIEICGKTRWRRSANSSKSLLTALQHSDPDASSQKDTHILGFIPNIQEGMMTSEKLQEMDQMTPNTGSNSSPSESLDSGFNIHSQKKRSLSGKCCFRGCTIKELSKGC